MPDARRALATAAPRNPVANKAAQTLSPRLGTAEMAYCLAVAIKYVKDEDAAADVAQDAMLLAHRHRHSFRGQAQYSTWLYRIASTTALMHLRKQRRTARHVSEPGGEPCGDEADLRQDSAPDPEGSAANRQALRVIERRLEELGERYARIFWMRYLLGYTETEIGQILGLNLSTVKSRAHRARVAVREALRVL